MMGKRNQRGGKSADVPKRTQERAFQPKRNLPETLEGTVEGLRGIWLRVRMDLDGKIWRCRGGLHDDFAVGDRILAEPSGHGEARPLRRLERTTFLERGVANEKSKCLAANADQAFIVVSVQEPPLREGLIDRFLVLAEYGRLKPNLVINKVDLSDAEEEAKRTEELYSGLGYPVFRVSALEGIGLEPLRAALMNTMSVFAGHSGVGKSTLLGELLDLDLETGAVNPVTGKGRHTTTRVEWLRVNESTVILDTPGVKDIGLHILTPAELSRGFREFLPYLAECHFRDCTHSHEEDCAVKRAVKEGRISRRRYRSYLSIIENP